MDKQMINVVQYEDHHNGVVELYLFHSEEDAFDCAARIMNNVWKDRASFVDVSHLFQQEKISQAMIAFNEHFQTYSINIFEKEVE